METVPPSALRQPPPPGRFLLVDSNTVPAPATGKEEEYRSNVRSRPFYRRRCKKGNPSNSMIEALPDDLLIEILLRLPADDIYENARLVCRRWRHLMHTDVFVQTHLHRTSSGLLLFDPGTLKSSSSILVTATSQGRVEISELSCRVKFPIMCSCDGLALCLREDEYGREAPFIFNPATNRAFKLPKTFTATWLLVGLGIAYAAASMAYKVVGPTNCGILTVGVDNAWRDVAVEGLSPLARWALLSCPLMTRGFLHWVSATHVVSLNVETETFTETRKPGLVLPPDCKERKYWYVDLSTGECLSLFVSRGDWSWEVWELKSETWEWRKVFPNLDLEAHKCKIKQFASKKGDVLKPFGWVRYPEVLAFCFVSSSPSCIIYNLGTKKIDYIKLSTTASHHRAVQHRNSLVWS